VANMLKNSWTLAVSVAINISMKLCFVSLNGPRDPHFVDEPPIYSQYQRCHSSAENATSSTM
jgi:hypothetical protein